MMKRIIAMIMAVAMLFCLASCGKNNENKDNNKDEAGPVNPEEVVVKSENFSFDLGEATYLFEKYFYDFYTENQYYISYYGIDLLSSLKGQVYSNDVTWFDYFASLTETYMKEVLVFCEAAKAAGKSLSEEDVAEIDKIVEEYEDQAKNNGYASTDELVAEMYGKIVTVNDLRSFLEKEKLAFNHYNDIVLNYSYTEAEEDEYLKSNPDKFYYVDYVYYVFEEKNDREALYNAKDLAATEDSEAFYAFIEDYENNVLNLAEEKKVGASESKYVLKEGEVGKWAFSAKAGDKYVEENGKDGVYTVYMLTSESALQEYSVRDIRYICLTKDTYQTNEKIKAKAEKILAEWDETEKTAEDFGKLATQYSEDDNTSGNGGIYKNVDMSNSILSDEGIKWLFEDAQVGDVTTLKGDGIYYIIYLENIGKEQWRVVADEAMAEKQYAKDSEDMITAHKVEVIKEALYKIDR